MKKAPDTFEQANQGIVTCADTNRCLNYGDVKGDVVEDMKLNTYSEKNIDSGDDCL